MRRRNIRYYRKGYARRPRTVMEILRGITDMWSDEEGVESLARHVQRQIQDELDRSINAILAYSLDHQEQALTNAVQYFERKDREYLLMTPEEAAAESARRAEYVARYPLKPDTNHDDPRA